MRITKHHQSCLIIADDDRGTIGIDLGSRPQGSYDLDALGRLDAVLYTHRHADHVDVDLVGDLAARGVALFGNDDVCQALVDHDVTVINAGDTTTVAGWTVAAYDLPHVVMIDGSPGPLNTGFLLDDRLFHPGDGLQVEGVSPDILAVPIAGPSISLHNAWQMVQRLGPSIALPIHYDVFPADPQRFADSCALADVVLLAPGQTVEL